MARPISKSVGRVLYPQNSRINTQGFRAVDKLTHNHIITSINHNAFTASYNRQYLRGEAMKPGQLSLDQGLLKSLGTTFAPSQIATFNVKHDWGPLRDHLGFAQPTPEIIDTVWGTAFVDKKAKTVYINYRGTNGLFHEGDATWGSGITSLKVGNVDLTFKSDCLAWFGFGPTSDGGLPPNLAECGQQFLKYLDTLDPSYLLVISGHSAGTIPATAASAIAALKGFKVKTILYAPVPICTEETAKLLESKVEAYWFAHDNDVVPTLRGKHSYVRAMLLLAKPFLGPVWTIMKDPAFPADTYGQLAILLGQLAEVYGEPMLQKLIEDEIMERNTRLFGQQMYLDFVPEYRLPLTNHGADKIREDLENCIQILIRENKK